MSNNPISSAVTKTNELTGEVAKVKEQLAKIQEFENRLANLEQRCIKLELSVGQNKDAVSSTRDLRSRVEKVETAVETAVNTAVAAAEKTEDLTSNNNFSKNKKGR